MFDLNILEHCIVRLHSSCGTDLGWTIKMSTDNIYPTLVVKTVYRIPTFPLTAKRHV